MAIATTAKPEARQWYAERAGAWSRAQLEAAIATRLHDREAAAITNFEQTLQAGDAEAVQRITRDPLVLDFVELTESARERDLEAALLSDRLVQASVSRCSVAVRDDARRLNSDPLTAATGYRVPRNPSILVRC